MYKSNNCVREEFNTPFPQSTIPSKSTKLYLADKFHETACLYDPKNTDQSCLFTAEVLNDVSNCLTYSPRK